MKYQFITIEGNIGAGKTSLVNLLGKQLNAKVILEQFDNNPFLPDFYKDPDRNAFPLELFFMAERYQQIKRELESPELFSSCTISDYIFQKSLIFAGVTLNENEEKLYRRLFDIINTSLPTPEIILFLNPPIEKLLSNIAKRGRSYEQFIRPDYLQAIHERYMNYFKLKDQLKVVIINTEKLDFLGSSSDLNIIHELLDQSFEPGIHYI